MFFVMAYEGFYVQICKNRKERRRRFIQILFPNARTWNAVSIEFHTSFCMQWIAESSDSIDDSAGEQNSARVLAIKKHTKPQISPWKRLDFDVILLLFRLVLLLLLIVLLLSCCSDVCEGFDWKEYVNWRLICLLYWSFSRGTAREKKNKNKKVLMKIIDVPSWLMIDPPIECTGWVKKKQRFATTKLNVIMMTRKLKGLT